MIELTKCLKADSNAPCYYKNGSGSDAILGENKYCMFTDNKIYLSKSNACSAITDKAIYLKSNDDLLYSKEDFGANIEQSYGLIYRCDNTCRQEISSLFKDETTNSIYSCNDNGLCYKNQFISIGFYVSNYNATDSTYSELIQCTKEETSSCNSVDIVPGYYVDGQRSGDSKYYSLL